MDFDGSGMSSAYVGGGGVLWSLSRGGGGGYCGVPNVVVVARRVCWVEQSTIRVIVTLCITRRIVSLDMSRVIHS